MFSNVCRGAGGRFWLDSDNPGGPCCACCESQGYHNRMSMVLPQRRALIEQRRRSCESNHDMGLTVMPNRRWLIGEKVRVRIWWVIRFPWEQID